MKRIFSLMLAVLLLVSAIPTALAANDYSQGTQVVYEATGSESYTVTVPAQLAPGGNGTVTLSGTWADNRIVTVTSDPTVTLTNSIKAEDQKVLNVNFNGISEAGSNTGSQTFTEGVSVDDITNALFGTWSGRFNYNVNIADVPVPAPVGATFSDGTFLTWEELKLAENGTKYVYDEILITDDSIGEGAFYGCSSLTSIVLPNSVTSIVESAFQGCTSLTSITIPDSVTSIGESAFADCSGLTSISIPDSVTSITNSAFYRCTSLTSITIPNSVTSIGICAFAGCTGLTSITIPDSVTSIGQQAFYNTSLTDVYYTGTQEQWNAITIGSINTPLTSATKHYNYVP